MNKLDVGNLDPSNPVNSMFLQLLMLARMSSSEKKIVSDLYERIAHGRNLTGPQTSMLTAIYLKYHDLAPESVKPAAKPLASKSRPETQWSRLLSR
jgi:hypothetical protein